MTFINKDCLGCDINIGSWVGIAMASNQRPRLEIRKVIDSRDGEIKATKKEGDRANWVGTSSWRGRIIVLDTLSAAWNGELERQWKS